MVAVDTSSEPQSSSQTSDNHETSLVIPITSSSTSNNFVEIFPHELVDISANALMTVLRDESSDLSTWADAALAYIQQGHAREACDLLQAACDLPHSSKEARVRILASAGIAYLTLPENEETRSSADARFTQSSKVDTLFPMQWIGRGMLNLSIGRMDQARFFFETTLKQCGQVLPALLGMAAVSFGEGLYQPAQDYYGQALRLFPHKSGAAARVGFGLACVKLGQVDRAKAAFERALELDSENVSAMVASALLDMASVDNEYSSPQDFRKRTETAIKKISMANLLDHSNAMVQNHLANHYFWKWTPIVGMTVAVTKNSNILTRTNSNNNTPIPLEPGERIRVGPLFTSWIVDSTSSNTNSVEMKHAWTEDSQESVKVWKRDYDRVMSLAKGAYNSTSVAEMRAESLLHQARVHHVRRDFGKAHLLYDLACKHAPDLTVARFGLAQTHVEREEFKHAAAHLKLVLGTNVTATDALALLGLLECKSNSKYTQGLHHLKKAISLEPQNAGLCLWHALALQQRPLEYPVALKQYQKAVELLQNQDTQVPFEVLVNMGVLCHELNLFDDALDNYKSALETLDQHEDTMTPTLNNVGMEGGMIRHGDNSMFCGMVDTTLEVKVPEETDTDKKIIQMVGNADMVSSLVVGDIIKVGDVLETQIDEITSNDDGTTMLKIKHDLVLSKQDTSQDQDKENNKDDSQDKLLPLHVMRENARLKGNPSVLSVAFNIARLHEAAGRILAAVELHKAIVKRNPTYTNSYLRLACIARDCGSLKECTMWLQLSRMSSPANNETLTLMGNLHLSLCDWQRAQSVFDSLLSQKIPQVEAYAMLSLGTIYFCNLKTPKKYSKHLQYAADYYKRILQKDKTNIYAANGLGTILAEKGELFKAKQVFNRVREVSGDTVADAHVNLGHVYLAQKKHPEALQMYQSYMKKAQDVSTPVTSKSRTDTIVEVLLYIAFAYFDWARQTEAFNDSRAAPADGRYKKCMEHLEMAMAKSERENTLLKYNYCMAKLQAANCVLQKLTRNIRRTAQEVQEALTNLQESLPQVQQILQWKNEGKKVLISKSLLQDFCANCKSNIESAKSHLEEERKKEEDAKAVREMQQWEAETQRKERQVLLLEKQAMEAKEQEEREKKARSNMIKLEQLQQGWMQEEEHKRLMQERKKAKSKKSAEAPGVEEEPDVFDDQVPAVDETAALFEDSESDDDQEEVEPNAAEQKDNEESKQEESAEGANAAETATSKDLFGDSSDEESDEELVPADDGNSGTKRPAADEGTSSTAEGPAKKRRVLDDDEDE